MSERPKDLSREIVRKYLPLIAWRRVMKLEQRGNFDEKYPEDAITAFLVSGKQYFDKDLLIARKRELKGFQPFQTFANGQAKLFHQRVPGRRYLIGADVATGREVTTEDTDYSAAVVVDLETGEEMAGYRAKIVPEDFAFDLADLGRYYNDAVIAVERTGDGGTTILTLQGEAQYPAVYKHREWVKRGRRVKNAQSALGVMLDVEGFPTTPKTRPIALNKLNRFLMEHIDLIWDEEFINEALVFVRDEKGVPKATEGAHDDRVSARWIAYYVRMAQLGYFEPWNTVSEKYESADKLTAIS